VNAPVQLTCRNCATAFVADPSAARCPRCGYAEAPTTKSPLAATSTDRSAFSAPVSQPVPQPYGQPYAQPTAQTLPVAGPMGTMPQANAPMVPYGAPPQMQPYPQQQPQPGYAYPPGQQQQQQPYYAPQPQYYQQAPQPIVVIQNQVNAPYPMHPYAMMPYVKRKDPGVAALISFFLPGGGQLYNGQAGKGIAFMFVTVVNFFLLFVGIGFLTGIATWIWSMIDAHQVADRINRGEIVA
jgi:TM2 domain-containing membrane protein YozV